MKKEIAIKIFKLLGYQLEVISGDETVGVHRFYKPDKPSDFIQICTDGLVTLGDSVVLNKDTLKALFRYCSTLWSFMDRDALQKVNYEGDDCDNQGHVYLDTAYCPECGRVFEVDYDEHSAYCPSCGQRLDWSLDDEEEDEESKLDESEGSI